MTHSKYSRRAVCLLAFLPMLLTAQRVPEKVVPLRNWASPLYWHPNQAEKEATAKPVAQNAAPQLAFSTNAASPDALTFVAITPCRLVDTRGATDGFSGIEPFVGPSIAGAATVTFPVQSSSEAIANTMPAPCGAIPSIAEAYSLNLTVLPQAGGVTNYVTLWATGSLQPVVSTLNDTQGLTVANAAIVAAGTSGSVNLYNSGPATVDVVIDMNGYFAAPSDLNGNTAIGAGTLAVNSGADNTATGTAALNSNTSGINNTASGYSAMYSNTSGNYNTASGYSALASNTIGSYNTATGQNALLSNVGGSDNTATGFGALVSNASGVSNTASGLYVMEFNSSGSYNTASGQDALYANTAGASNTAIGFEALNANTSGNTNIAIGSQAATLAPPTNGNSIYLSSQGTGSDAPGTIRIGTQGAQTGGTYVAGINGVITGLDDAVNVVIDSNGQLGTVNSSERFKEDIQDMGDASSGLLRLRPVTYRYKQAYKDGSKPMDYGLIAEEVADVYPDLVVKNNEGQIQTVQYQKLTPMLLNEVQKQAEQIREQADQIRKQAEENRGLEGRLTALEARLPTAPEPVR